jgi:hypothetical protein
MKPQRTQKGKRVTLDAVAGWLSQYRFASASEAMLQQAVSVALSEAGLAFERERSLSHRDRIDFYCDGKVGIECKIDGSVTEVIRQLLRYAESEEIEGLVLVTSRAKHRRMPPTLGGKPVHVVLTRAF